MIRWVISGVLLLSAFQAEALCNNPKNWLESPSEGVKIFVGYRHPRPNDEYFDAASQSKKLYIGYPPPLPQAMLEKPWPGKLTEKENPETDAEKQQQYVSFFEPDGKGQWRLCREEQWLPKRTKGWWGKPLELEDGEIDQYSISDAGHKNVPVLGPWLKTHFSNMVEIFQYDNDGRLIKNFSVYRSVYPTKSTKISPPHCWRYDDKNRITLQLDARVSNACPKGEPDLRDFFYRRAYFNFNEDDGTPTYRTTWDEINYGDEKGDWAKRIAFTKLIDPNNPNPNDRVQGGNARADAKRGVTEILGGYRLGERENSIGPTFKYASGGEPPIEYLFVNNDPPVPYEMLKDPDNIYKYNRRRDTEITRTFRLHEYFPANQTRIKERFFTAFVRTLRQEQLDDDGRLKRAINVGRFSRKDEEFGFYDEDFNHAKISFKLKGHELYYRVWDYDKNGKATLVALGWGSRLSLGHPAKIDEAKILFGTPDGVVRWKSKEEFFQAFDFDPRAKRAFAEAYIPR